jgi:peptidoglycan/xylan/chitin deacetylase (PgdA/CDA1 family)
MRPARSGSRLLGRPVSALLILVLRLTGRRAGVALVYHGLASRTGDPDLELVAPHGEQLFESQLRYLAAAFRLVDASELPAAVAARRRGERFPAAVTLDDDLASHMTVALPILERVGIKATFFLTGATLRGPHSFWWQKLQRLAQSNPERLTELSLAAAPADTALGLHELARRVEQLDPTARQAFEERLGAGDGDAGLDAEDVRALCEAGPAIGFHTRRHEYLPRLGDDELARALDEGRAELEELVGRRLTAIAYPHGAADARVAAAARAAGFDVGYTGVPRAVRAADDPLLLGRLSPSHRSAGHFALQLAAALLGAQGAWKHQGLV